MVTGADIIIGLEIVGIVCGALVGFIAFLWRAFTNIAKLHNRITLLERDIKTSQEAFEKIYNKLDQMSKDLHEMRVEMLEAHGGLGTRLAKLEK